MDPNWAEWPMPNNLADAATGAPNPQGYTYGDGAEQTLIDDVTQLMWQKDMNGQTYTWADAISYCQTLTLGGFAGWRLPSLIELISLVDYSVTAANGAALISGGFTGPAEGVWSSTTVAGTTTQAWMISLAAGTTITTDESATLAGVRCVR